MTEHIKDLVYLGFHISSRVLGVMCFDNYIHVSFDIVSNKLSIFHEAREVDLEHRQQLKDRKRGMSHQLPRHCRNRRQFVVSSECGKVFTNRRGEIVWTGRKKWDVAGSARTEES
jgi:hypothetical protein